ncbi:MAG: hypothetical protein JO257_08365, partial [Deltaproteobacteria bacterium]|nr:hypothetical protein [Deltaproteobacteria bacterium]
RALLVRFYMRKIHYYLGVIAYELFQLRKFHFKMFFHPFACDFAKRVYDPMQGIPGLMRREVQLQDTAFSFKSVYLPTPNVVDPSTEKYYPHENVDFDPDGAYAPYNWELFFHAPLLVANLLSQNQQFEQARDWYHYIFNPIGVESAQPGGSLATSKYWITKPFYETTDRQYLQQRIENLLAMLAGDTTTPGYDPNVAKDVQDQVRDWRDNPFEPHRIAAYRTVAYQKTVVMKYLDNLIAWGDNLFRQDSMESINEATQLYVLAAEILGPRPQTLPPRAIPPLETFNEIEPSLDAFANALVEVENIVPTQPGNDPGNTPPLPMLYFCIPHNDKLLGYWDTIADRLYKIRHCMNIDGVVRQLALFEPPIDPGALVKAVAGGVDLSAALADLQAPVPFYRFSVILQKAQDVCADLKGLSSALLAALEKNDGEELALLRQSQERQLLDAIRVVRQHQVDEATESLENAKHAKTLAETKKKYYESRDFMNAGEIAATTLSAAGLVSQAAGVISDVLAGVMFLIPDFKIGASGFGGSPHFAAEIPSGNKVANSTRRGANGLYNLAQIFEKSAQLSSTIAGYQRRQDEWDFQKDIATKEMDQIDHQIAAAQARLDAATQELTNHDLQIENAKAVDDLMHSKYTNQELYRWQIGQVSGVYFQTYKLAYDLAKRAERCLRYELGLQDSSYISFGYWDSLKKGLLAGEKLQYDLRRLEAAYIDQNRREFELTKHVSLALLDPIALVTLRETGRCFFRVPEELFDLDYPGHYFRRIKSVSITLPAVRGPYTTVSCTMRLLKNSYRVNTLDGDNGYPHNVDDDGLPIDDPRFVESNVQVRAIATSAAQDDAGVFELAFRDERYLPFEGAGAVSDWSLELFTDIPSNNPDPANPDYGRPLRQFDYATITDAVVHVKYTAREDAGGFRNRAISHLRDYFSEDATTPGALMLDLRRDFPMQWSRFQNPTNTSTGNVFELEVSSDLFPFRDANRTLKINSLQLLARCTDAGNYTAVLSPPLPAPPPMGSNTMTLARNKLYGGLHFNAKAVDVDDIVVDPTSPATTWKIKVTRPGGANLAKDDVEDAYLVLGYQWA